MSMQTIIITAFRIYYYILIARVILSWVKIPFDSPFRPIVDIIHSLTEPVLGPIRKLMPSGLGLDFSPIIAIFGMQFLQRIVLGMF